MWGNTFTGMYGIIFLQGIDKFYYLLYMHNFIVNELL